MARNETRVESDICLSDIEGSGLASWKAWRAALKIPSQKAAFATGANSDRPKSAARSRAPVNYTLNSP